MTTHSATETKRGAAECILDLVGGTPLLRLGRFTPKECASIYAKLEFVNPGGSVKDRAALGMIDEAERTGALRPGGTIVEPTAGNTGVGLALVAIARGYRVIVVVPEKFRGPKTAVMDVLGAEVVFTPTEKAMPYAIEKAKEIAAGIPGAYVPQQFENADNPRAHYRTTAPEIHEQLGALPDAIVLGAGTGGTFTGVATYFKERRAAIHCALVEPYGSTLGGGVAAPHKVEGIGASFWPKTLDRAVVDEIITVKDDDAFDTVRQLGRTEALLVGGSSGAAAWAATIIGRRLGPGATVVTLFPDGFERYLGKGPF